MSSALSYVNNNSVSNIHKPTESNPNSSMTKCISEVCNTNNAMPANLENMQAVPADSLLDPSGKLTDGAKKVISQKINEFAQTSNSSPDLKTTLFFEHATSLIKAKLNETHSDEQLKQLANIPTVQAIDDSALVRHFINTKALEGKLARFSNQIDSFKGQKLDSAKAAHLAEAFRALEESIETLLMPNLPLTESGSGSTTSEEIKQPTVGVDETDGRTPVNGAAKPQTPTTGGNVYYHFGDNISRVSTDKEPVNVNVTVNVNGTDTTHSVTVASSEKEAQEAPNAFGETKNTAHYELNQQQSGKEEVPEKNISVIQDDLIQILSEQQDIPTQDYDVVDSFISDDIISSEEIELYTEPDKAIEEELEQPSMPLSRSQSELSLNDTGGYKKGADGKWTKEEQPFTPLSRSLSEASLNDTGGYRKGEDGKWTKEKLHSKTDVVLSQGATQSNNIAGKRAYSLSDIRGNDIDRANEAKAGNTLTVDLKMNIDDKGNVEPEIQSVNISVSPEKPSFSLRRRGVSQQSSLKRSFSANDVQTADSSNINKLTGQPFKYSVSVDNRVILTRDAQVQSLSRKNSYIEDDTRFGAKADEASS